MIAISDIPLKERLRVTLEMNDYDNWDDGEYKGDQSELLEYIMEDVREWIKDGADFD